jgi:outer membrane protein
MLKKITIAALFLLTSVTVNGQYSLEDFISTAQKKNFTAEYNRGELEIATLVYKQYKLSANPMLMLSGNVPVFNKDNYGITQPDGTIKFLRRQQNYSNIGFAIAQPLPFTGGTLSLNSELYRFDDFETKTKQYNSTPVFLQWQQPLFAYNRYKWDKLIEPLKWHEAKQTYALQQNQLANEICTAFFDVIDAQTDQQLADVNLSYSSVNLSHEKRKLQLGTSTEDKVMQLEIQLLNNEREKENAKLAVQTAIARLKLIINSTDTSTYELRIPENLPKLTIDKEPLLGEAKKQLPQYIGFQRKLIEAKSNTAQVIAQNNQVNLTASYGLTNSAATLSSIYQNPNDQQRFSIGFTVPLITWGKNKNSINTAKLKEEQIELANKIEEAKMIAEIASIINEIPLLQKNIITSKMIDTLTQKRFAIANRMFETGKVSLLELQAAQTEKDNARRNYIRALRKFWENLYLLRVKTNAKIF